MEITAKRILSTLPEFNHESLQLDIKFGFDGSGSHAIYNQINNQQTHNIIISMFCPLSLKTQESTIWEQTTPNNPLTHRPIQLQMGKESAEALRSLEIHNEQIHDLKNNGFTLEIKETETNVKVNIISHMMDMKAAHLYLGLGGAFCDLCDFSKEQCHNVDVIANGFKINRTVQDLHNIFEDIQQDGEVVKASGDYNIRGGLTTKPIPTSEVKSVQVLHGLLRSFDHFMKVCVHLLAHVYDWSESPHSTTKAFLTQAKKEIQVKIHKDIGEQWDIPDQTGKGGTTTNGNTARKLLHVHRDIIVNMLPEKDRAAMTEYGQKLSVILRLMSSSSVIDVESYMNLCTDAQICLLTSYPWVKITPSLHKVFAHSWELIELNDDRGLKNLDESGLEGNNKILRNIRMNLSRKTSQQDNLTDCIRRLCVSSDPILNQIRADTKPFCAHCSTKGHSTRYCMKRLPPSGPDTSDDALFKSLLA